MKKKIHIVIITVESGLKHKAQIHCSKRADYSWAAWIGSDLKLLLEHAESKKKAWESTGYGPYVIAVGTLEKYLKEVAYFRAIRL